MLHILYVTCYLFFQLKGAGGYGVEALKRYPKVRSVTPQKRVERFLRSVQGKIIHFSNFFAFFYLQCFKFNQSNKNVQRILGRLLGLVQARKLECVRLAQQEEVSNILVFSNL